MENAYARELKRWKGKRRLSEVCDLLRKPSGEKYSIPQMSKYLGSTEAVPLLTAHLWEPIVKIAPELAVQDHLRRSE